MGKEEAAVRAEVKEIGISKIKMDEKIWLKLDPDCVNLYSKESGNIISTANC